MSNSTLMEEVEKTLNSIRPYLAADGGGVRVLGVDNTGKVTLELLGNCGLCPMSEMTFRAGVEELIMKTVPSITSVEAVNSPPLKNPKVKLPSQLP